MPKRVTYIRLISYIESLNEEKGKIKPIENVTDKIEQVNINPIDKHPFEILPNGESKSINDFPKKLKGIFDPFIADTYRWGTIQQYKDLNSSLLASVLYCLDSEFVDANTSTKVSYIETLKTMLTSALREGDLYKKYDYKELGWKKTELRSSIVEMKNNKILIRFLADYFGINIFLLNITDDKVFAIYSEENFNIFKVSIFLSFYENIFEPITFKDSGKASYNTPMLKKVVNVDKESINILNVNMKKEELQKFNVEMEDLDKYDLEEEEGEDSVNKFDEIEGGESIEELDDPDETETEIEPIRHNKDIFHKKKGEYTLIEIKKMKIGKIREIAEEYGLNIETNKKTAAGKSKLKTKTQLIEEIEKEME